MLRYGGERIFADELRVTYSPEHNPCREVADFVVGLGAEPYKGGLPPGVRSFYMDRGKVDIEERGRFALIAATGKAIAALDAMNGLGHLVMLLASEPHRVSRLDVACDIQTDAPRVIRAMHRRYPVEFPMGRKKIGAWTLLKGDRHGQVSGSWYAGRRGKTRVQPRVYDKAQEMWEEWGEEIPPTVRVEIECSRHVGATLRDFLMPESLFWHYASPNILQAPPDVEFWKPGDSTWETKRPPPLPAETVRRRVEGSAELKALASLGASLGPKGHELVRAWVLKAFDSARPSPSVTSH